MQTNTIGHSPVRYCSGVGSVQGTKKMRVLPKGSTLA